jgi:hypothetical protein
VLMVVGIAVFSSITAALAGRLIHASESDDAGANDRIRELEATVAHLSTALEHQNSGRGDALI